MHIPVEAIRILQRELGFRGAAVDGVAGKQTERKLDTWLGNRKADLAAPHAAPILAGSRRRKVTAAIQLLAKARGIDAGTIDGYWGPQTDFACDSLIHVETDGSKPPVWRDDPAPPPNPNRWPPENDADLKAFYGQPGTNQVSVGVPYVHKLAWDLNQRVTRIRCHAKVADSLLRVLGRVLDHYGQQQISDLHLDHWGGCFNKRRIRGGSRWSTHAWGIALDYDPARNQLKWGRDRAWFARPEYDPWWQFWEEEGWVSLGRARNYDWMHVQAARR